MGLLKRQLCRLDNCNNSERSSRKFIKSNNSTSEAPYQMLGQRSLSSALGHKELYSNHFWLSLLSECLSCYIYVFIVCSTRISWTGAMIGHEPNLLAMALSSGLAMMLLIFTFRTVHVNPALTVAFAVTGRIPLIRAIAYILMHCVGAIAAIAFLHTISIKGHAGALGLDNPHSNLNSWQILIVEAVISFVVTLVTYATCNYSSYTGSRKLTLEQLGSDCSAQPSYYSCVESSRHDCDNKQTPQGPLASVSKRSVAPIVSVIPSTSISIMNQDLPMSNDSNSQTTVTMSNMRNNLLSNGLLLGSYNDSSSQHEYEYDNHRIYATQQNQLRTETSSQIPIEEVMKEESQLLAPNGFSMHITKGQAFVIGLAYTLTSLSGIPASGASLNPARSFGPAFVMNRWDRHWIYWLGPALGAVVAGIFYEFIFNPTRKSSLCYRPKLFRLSAQDVAKVVAKTSRQYQQQQQQQQQFPQKQQMLSSPTTLSSGLQHITSSSFRAQQQQQQQQHFVHQHQTMQHSPNTRAPSNNLISSGPFPKPSTRDVTAATTKTGGNSQKPPYLFAGGQTLNPMSYLQQQQHQDREHQLQQQFLRLASHGAANFDRNKSSAIVNPLVAINSTTLHQHQASFNMAAQRSQNQELGFRQQLDRVHYDDPSKTTSAAPQRRSNSQHLSQTSDFFHDQTRRSLMVGPDFAHHRFELDRSTTLSKQNLSGQQQEPTLRHLFSDNQTTLKENFEEKLDDGLYNVLDGEDFQDIQCPGAREGDHLNRLEHEMGHLSNKGISAHGRGSGSRKTEEIPLVSASFNGDSDGSHQTSICTSGSNRANSDI